MILLRPEALPFVKLDSRTFVAGDRHRRIVATAIDHDALIAEGKAVEAGADIRRLVFGNDDGAERRHQSRPDPYFGCSRAAKMASHRYTASRVDSTSTTTLLPP